MFHFIALSKAYRLLNHGPTILVSASHSGKQNIMAEAWNMLLDFDPPKICVVIDKNTFTCTLIEGAGTFAINVPCVAQIDLVQKLGSTSGWDFLSHDRHCEQGEAIQCSKEEIVELKLGLPRRDATRNDTLRDKFTENNLETFAAKEIAAPLLKGCVAWLECKVIPEPHNQNTYDFFIAEVVAAYADERVVTDGRWHFEGDDQETLDKLRTIHHVAGGAFFATGKSVQALTSF
jgi:flavin reductase (DIM6/NTAB) family NADH-FMN oxidoreductase RutF